MSSSSQLQAEESLWSSLREAIAGSPRDFTEGSISKAITLLAVPMVLEMAMESLFGVVDAFFVAHLGADAVATVGFTESVLTLVFAVALGLSMGTTAMIARRIGEKDPRAASTVAAQAIWLGLAVSAIAAVVGVWFAPDLLRLMGASESIIRTGTPYTRVIWGSTGTILLLFLINAVFRGAGDASVAMRSLWLANLINIALNPCLILGLGPFPELGLTGSAVGTSIGRGAGVLYQLWKLSGGRGRVTVHLSDMKLEAGVMFRLIRVSIGGMFQYFVAVASWIGLIRMVAEFGSAAVAGYTLALRIVVFALLPSWGMSNAAATLVGQNLGAQKPDRAESSVWRAGFYNMIFLGLVALTFVLFAEPIIGVFTDDSAVRPIAANCMRIVSYGYIFYAWGMVMVQAFNGAGDTYTPTLINLLCYWLWQIPLAWWLSFRVNLGSSGIFFAIAIAESTLAILGILAFRRGTWKRQQL